MYKLVFILSEIFVMLRVSTNMVKEWLSNQNITEKHKGHSLLNRLGNFQIHRKIFIN